MKARFEDIQSRKGQSSLLAYRFTTNGFPFQWHYHPEMELTLIIKGEGMRWVGDNYARFQDDDLVLLGQGLPHTWASTNRKPSSAVVIQFPESLLEPIAALPEFSKVKSLLSRSRRGLTFPAGSARQQILALPRMTGARRVTALLEIVRTLAEVKSSPISSAAYVPTIGSESERRINKVFNFMARHAAGPITLEETAHQVHLSKSAFCKFFLRTTGRTYSDHLNEIRIGNASSMLIDTDLPVADIAEKCGYESLTYFNRVFKRKQRVTPQQYRRMRT